MFKITATPARHHPRWLPGIFAGSVNGFIIEYDAQKNGVIYISGDIVLFDKLNLIGEKYEVDLAILHLGSVRFPYLTGKGKYTMNARDGVILATKLNVGSVIPIHTSGWSHFKESEAVAREVFSTSDIADKVLWLTAGKALEL